MRNLFEKNWVPDNRRLQQNFAASAENLAPGSLFGRQGREGEGVDRSCHLLRQQRVDPALAGEAAEAGEGGRDDLDMEMRLALRACRRMAGMTLGIVADDKPRRLQRHGQFLSDAIGDTHGEKLGRGTALSRRGRGSAQHSLRPGKCGQRDVAPGVLVSAGGPHHT